MTDQNPNTPATIPEQPEAKPPLKKGMPVVIVLVAILAILGIANVSSLLRGNKKTAPASALQMRPTSPNAQQVSSFETQQQLQAQHDAEEKQKQQELVAAMQQLQATEGAPGPESASAAPMTSAQRDTIYGSSPNAPQHTSNVSEAQAEVKQRALARQKQKQDAINSGTVAIDFAHSGEAAAPSAAITATAAVPSNSAAADKPVRAVTAETKAAPKADAMGSYEFDQYQGRLYRIFEGTVFEGVVTNHIDGGFSGPILVMLTTDYYSHDHQQLLMPQGTRLIGTVQSVGNAQQRKMFVIFHRAVCPDGFSLDFDKYIGLDPIGTTGLATKVDHGYLMAFGAAAAIGGLGGLAQIGNNSSVLDSSTQIRNGISEQTAAEGEQVLNHFLNRLPVITLKEGSRARVYVGRDILIPSYAEHRMDPAL
ncbi:TrbI/VirB10 family protein [Telmatobacter bradus]|jgi:type IV secretion system protein VirB10|uniref:TrbI/VirB10 family protein n=1 Tax=Telmatobacter bradus TaxID=474953 RepID=UPI003B42BA53